MGEPLKDLRERLQEYQRLERAFAVSGPFYPQWFQGRPPEDHPRESYFRPGVEAETLTHAYRNHGVEWTPHHPGEAPDHLAVELEFMAVLIAREMRAVTEGDGLAAHAWREAQAQFFFAHPGEWAARFAVSFAHQFPEACPARLAARLEQFMGEETLTLGHPQPS